MSDDIKKLWFEIQHYGHIKNALDQDMSFGFYTYTLYVYEGKKYTSMQKNGELLALYNMTDDEIVWSVDDERK
jgi:hypothetical protein